MMIKLKNAVLTAIVAVFMIGGVSTFDEASVNANAQTVKTHHPKRATKKHVKKHVKKATKKHAKKTVKKHVAKKNTKKKAHKFAKKHVAKKVTKTSEPKVKELAPKGVTPKGYQPYQVRHLYGNVWENVTTHEKTREIKGSMYPLKKPKGRDWKNVKQAKDGRYYTNTKDGRVYIGAGGELQW